MSSLQLDYSWDELMADPVVAEPFRAGEVLCHGGLLADGTYASPRSRFRPAAIRAWQESHRDTLGTDLLGVPPGTWGPMFPSVEQARLLLLEGVREPIVSYLTRVAMAEGFGAMIRSWAPADMQPYFVEDIRGTATAHLGRGLVEAHARDEAGWDGQAGHDKMWTAVRDIAFESPASEEATHLVMSQLGIGPGSGVGKGQRVARFKAQRLFRELPLGLEMLVSTMCRVLCIEIRALRVFTWAETLFSDHEVVAGQGEAGRVVSCIRQDETPHIEYLRTALTEMRDRTFVGRGGRRRPGSEVVGAWWDRSLAESVEAVRNGGRATFTAALERNLATRHGGAELLERFLALDPVLAEAGGQADLEAGPPQPPVAPVERGY